MIVAFGYRLATRVHSSVAKQGVIGFTRALATEVEVDLLAA